VTVQIARKIVDYRVEQGDGVPTNAAPSAPPPPLMYDRPKVTEGKTYKIKPPNIGAAMYITINDVTLPDGSRRPFEIFIASKNIQHFQWIAALTRTLSAVFRKPGQVEFLCDELEQVFDPQGGYWDEGKIIPSVVAHIGKVLRAHCESIGHIQPKEKPSLPDKLSGSKVTQLCPDCQQPSAVIMDGCLTCTSCGYSKCS
jgi:ribonucleoside-diphosphate reductase alpha chain